MPEVVIRVTHADAADGLRYSHHRCPAAIALSRATGCLALVSRSNIALYRSNDPADRVVIETPAKLRARVLEWDQFGQRVFAAYSFALEVPEEWIDADC